MRVTLTIITCLVAMVVLVASIEGNFEAPLKNEKETKERAPISLEHESHAEDDDGSAFDSGSGASGSGRQMKCQRNIINTEN